MERLQDNRGVVIGALVGAVVVVGLVAAGLKQALVIGIISGAAYGLVALGLVLVYKSSGVFNFAQGEFGTVAVFVLWLTTTQGLPYAAGMLAAVAVALGMGLVTERLVVRPLFEAARVTLLVATAGVALLAVGIQIWFGEATPRRIDPAFPRFDRVSVFGIAVSDQRLLLIAVLVVLAGALALFFNRTTLGLAVLGASQEPTATELVGISVRRVSSFVWAMAALLGGTAGILAAPIGGTFVPGLFTSQYLIPAFTAAVLGGMTSLPGAFLGGIIVGVGQSAAVSAGFLADVPGRGAIATFVLLIVVLAVRPQGLLGKSA